MIPGLRNIINSYEIDSALIVGAGGGFDIFSGLPIFFHLLADKIDVHLASLCLIEVQDAKETEKISENCFRIGTTTRGLEFYFPERLLCKWLSSIGKSYSVYCIRASGVNDLIYSYEKLLDQNHIDTVFIVDTGFDSLVLGNEANIGTAFEDIAHLAALLQINIARKYLVCTGFGVDKISGISHYHILDSIAQIISVDGLLGVVALSNNSSEVQLYLDAVEFANKEMPHASSIAQALICSAIRGGFGDIVNQATRKSQGWSSPLMILDWFFKLEVVVNRLPFLVSLQQTNTLDDVRKVFHEFRTKTVLKKPRDIRL